MNYRTFYPKICHYSQKYGFGIRDLEKKPIPDPGSGSRGQKGTGSRIRIRKTAHGKRKFIFCSGKVVPCKSFGKILVRKARNGGEIDIIRQAYLYRHFPRLRKDTFFDKI
jgi:hypothetical protein